MVTETININIIESGSRVIKRRLDEIGEAADRGTRSIYLLQRALFVLGAGGLLSGITKMLDTLTNYENRLKLTASSVQNMEGVQQRLFEVAERSRTAFESVADIYSRTALSARSLGLSQQEVLDITESLSKAAILSGSNARESNAALVQLSQGLASNRLNGDELRSILEQLPYVADVIADYMTKLGTFGKVGRGELRKLGADGEITAAIVTAAFRDAKGQIDTAFAGTQKTIEQAIGNIGTQFLKLLDRFDDATGFSLSLANAIDFLANSLENLARALGLATSLLIAFFAAGKVSALLTAISAVNTYYSAIKAGDIVLLGSTRAEAMKAAWIARTTAARAADTASILAHRTAMTNALATSVAQLRQQQLDQAYTVTNGRARMVATGQFANLNRAKQNLITTTSALIVAENSLAASQGRLAAGVAANTAAQAAAATAAAGAATANAAAAGFWATLAARFPLLTAVVNAARVAIMGLWTLLYTNPITAIIATLAVLIAGLVFFGDKIYVASGSIVNLQDVAVGAFQMIMDYISPVTDAIGAGFSWAADMAGKAFDGLVSIVSGVFSTLLSIVSTILNALIGHNVGVVNAVIAAFGVVPGAIGDIFANAANLGIAAIEWMLNKMVDGINAVLGGINQIAALAGQPGITLLNAANLGRVATNGAAGKAGAAIGEAYMSGFKDYVGDATDAVVDGVMKRATTRAQDRAADNALIKKAQALNGPTTPTAPAAPPGGGGGKGRGGKGGGGNDASFNDWVTEKMKEIELLKLVGKEKLVQQEIDKLESQLKRQLTADEKEYVAQLTQRLIVAQQENEILQALRGPQEEMATRLEALNNLFKQGKIDIAEYNAELRNIAVAATSGQNTFLGGISNGLARVSQQANDFGKNISDWVVGSFDSATEAVVNFAKTGEFNIKEFFGEIFANLLKIMTNQIFAQLLGNLFGGIGGGGLLGGALPKFANGGDFMVGGTGGTDSRLVQFMASPDERVSIKTPEQQRAQENAMKGNGQGGGVQVVEPKVDVTIINEDDPRRTIHAMNTPAGSKAIMNVIRKNPDAIKRMLGS